jgi:F-type H+-transporting ATPase subunit epsilon
MNNFELILQSAKQSETIDRVISFKGADASGEFGILANHERFITSLKFGLHSFKKDSGQVVYLAAAGGVLYFIHNKLFINTRDYLYSDDYHDLVQQLKKREQGVEEVISRIKDSLHNLNEQFLRILLKYKK